jgi:4-hydroxyphenylpyruvate dioxygenase
VHVNDGGPPSGLDTTFEGRFRRRLPGDGTFDLAAFDDTLAAIGYDGPIGIEVLSTELRRRPPAEGARLLMESLRSLSRPDRASRGTPQLLRPRRSS